MGTLTRALKKIIQWNVTCLCRSVVVLGRILYNLEVRGQEYLPLRGPAIVILRHSSRADLFAIAFGRSVVKEMRTLNAGLTNLNSRFLIKVAEKTGTLPLYKERGFSAPSLLELYNALKHGEIVALTDNEMPWDGGFQLPRLGPAWLALRTGAPIIVQVLNGGYKIWPRWAEVPRLSGKLVVRYSEPMYLCDVPCLRITHEMLDEANRRILAKIKELCSQDSVPEERAQ